MLERGSEGKHRGQVQEDVSTHFKHFALMSYEEEDNLYLMLGFERHNYISATIFQLNFTLFPSSSPALIQAAMLGRGTRIPSPSISSARERASEERNERQAACVATFEWGRQRRQERDEEGGGEEEKGKEDRERQSRQCYAARLCESSASEVSAMT